MTGLSTAKGKWIATDRELVRMELVALASEVATLAWRAREHIERTPLTSESVDLMEECAALETTARDLLSRQVTFQRGSQATLHAALEFCRACRRDAAALLQVAQTMASNQRRNSLAR
jgi:hypothetical protein